VLLKVLKNQYFAAFVEAEAGKKLFNLSVTAIRKMSVSNNDLPGRLRDVLAYIWSHADTQIISGVGRDGLQLKIRGRMSMSVVYDSLWRWREQFEVRRDDSDGK
jgi:transcriptional regulatory protein LEU3